MKIFIGFGYNKNDQWIRDLVFPLVESFDATVITGEDLQGRIISQGVTDNIKKADGVLAFLTRRDPMTSGKFTTHRWVMDELSTAIANTVPAVEIRDIMVDPSGGLPGDRQRIEFDPENKAGLLVDIAKLISEWRRNLKTKRLVLLPKEIVQDARPHISKGDLECSYQFMNGSEESPIFKTKPFRFGRGLCVDVKNVPSESALVQITLQCPEFSWSSDYESIELLSVNLQKD